MAVFFSICLQTTLLTANRLVQQGELFVFITAIKKGNALMYSTLLAVKDCEGQVKNYYTKLNKRTTKRFKFKILAIILRLYMRHNQ